MTAEDFYLSCVTTVRNVELIEVIPIYDSVSISESSHFMKEPTSIEIEHLHALVSLGGGEHPMSFHVHPKMVHVRAKRNAWHLHRSY